MNENYRSTEDLISALNQIFTVENPFHDKDIPYQAVDKGDAALGEMTENGIKVIPVAINHFPKNEEITNFVKNEILRLLTTENALINGERIQPSDIAVLTRTNLQADEIKKELSSADIPSVTIDQTSVLESQEAGSILSLLSVVLKPDIGGINRVLLNDFFGLTRTDIEKLDPELHLDLFRELRGIWQDSGIYNFLFRFYDAYQVRKHCLDKGIIGQRALSNFYQIAEILHQVSLKTRYSSEELIVWLQREKTKKSEDYEQRIESEDNAVKIITIHKSKGLTFRIVFAPFLDLTIKDDVEIYDFRDTDGYKFTHAPDDRQSELYRTQSEQENRRLIYVALTRAQYKLYICENRYFTESSLKQFLKIEGPLFEDNLIRESAATRYHSPAARKVFTPRSNPGIEIKNTFGIHSFSGLSKAHYSAPFESADLNEKDKYDQFIFQDLGRGASVGTALHSIFERLNFAEAETWEQTLKDASKYYSTIIKEESLDNFMQLINHIMNTELVCDGEKFALNRIKSAQKLPEMQFYFSMESVNKTEINKILGEEADLEGEADIEGLMTGFIDLFFEYHGKYFILDWKSNHLGNSIDNYNRAGMEEAMKGSNYNLQYMIYTVAVKRWLEKRIENFNYDSHFGGIIYVFLRGVREGYDTGIFTTKPQTDKIEGLEKLLSNK
jgi:exodeoxyribonuclease V beta subunit